MDFFRFLKRDVSASYDVARLVDCKEREDWAPFASEHIICDIDKTYLETEFESVIRLIRIAFEAASDKITVTGASQLLKAVRWQSQSVKDKKQGAEAPLKESIQDVEPGRIKHDLMQKDYCDTITWRPRALHFVSSSPPQLRSVLEEKLILDGLDWSSDTFKNQAYNIKLGRMDLLRQHVAYKTYAILNLMKRAKEGSDFYLIGDNAESDAYIYMTVALLVSGQVQASGLRQMLEFAGVESDLAQLVSEFADGLVGRVNVQGVFIRRAPGYKLVEDEVLTKGIVQFDDFYELTAHFLIRDLLDIESFHKLTRQFHNIHGVSRTQIHALLEHFAAIEGLPQPYSDAFYEAMNRLGVSRNAAMAVPSPLNFEAISFYDKLIHEEDLLIDRGKAWAQAILSAHEATQPSTSSEQHET